MSKRSALAFSVFIAVGVFSLAVVFVAYHKNEVGSSFTASFTDSYRSGRINSQFPAGTPTRKGAFVFSIAHGGKAMQALTVLGGYRYSYIVPAIKQTDLLAFSLTDPLNVGKGVRAFVEVDGSRIFIKDLDPRSWINSNRIRLDKFVGKNVQIT